MITPLDTTEFTYTIITFSHLQSDILIYFMPQLLF